MVVGTRAKARWARVHLVFFLCLMAALPLVVCAAAPEEPGAEGTPPAPPSDQMAQTNAQEVVRAFLQLQEQLRATQLAIEQNRRETKATAVQTAETMSNALQAIQSTFVAQRARDLEATQAFSRQVLIIAGAFAALGVLTLLLVAYLQWSMSKGLAEISSALPAALGLGSSVAQDLLGPGEQAASPTLGVSGGQGGRPQAAEPPRQPASKTRRGNGWSLERLLFPRPGDSFRRRQFRALKTAMLLGLVCAAAVALVFYMMQKQPPV
jgi:hypothetical protein